MVNLRKFLKPYKDAGALHALLPIKRFIDDRQNDQIVLRADSSFDYEPIYLHADDDFNLSGRVIAVIKSPSRG